MNTDSEMFCIQLVAEPERCDELFLTLEELCPWGWEESQSEARLSITVYCPQEAELKRLQRTLQHRHPRLSFQVRRVPIHDWSLTWREFFHPLQLAKKFRILPSWEREVHTDPHEIPLVIEPGMAFGTGHHASTQLCLQALAELWESGRIGSASSFLDLGTGSGILGIAAVKMGCAGLALDIDPVAVANARVNQELNDAFAGLLLSAGTLECLKPGRRFSLILANILSAPLISMGPALRTRLEPSGFLVLSGILQEQEDAVIQAYTRQGVGLEQVLHQDEWSGLIFSKGPE